MQTRSVLRVSSSLCRTEDTERAAHAAAEQLAAGLNGEPARAALFFATTHHGPGYGRVQRAIAAATRAEHVVGCSAMGVIGGDGEIERKPGISALALAGDFEVRRLFVPSLRGRALEVGREIGHIAASLEREPRTLVLLADSYNLAPDELLAGVATVSPETTVIGGGASEDGSIGETSVVARDVVSGNAVVGLAIGGLKIRTLVTQACHPFGPWRTITRAESNRILELDGESALRGYLEALPPTLRGDLRQALRSTLAALRVEIGPEEIAPPYVVRRLIGADPGRGALVVEDEVVEGMRFAIAIRDARNAREDLDIGLERYSRMGGPLAGALYFNCVARGQTLYGLADLDPAYIQRRLGGVELAGLFCGVEFAPLGGQNRLHQYSGVLVGLESSGDHGANGALS